MGGFFSKTTVVADKDKKVILLTGASSGMGKETALTLIQRGHIVYGAARRVDQMQDLVTAGGHAIAMDVSNESQLKQAVKRVLAEQNGRIDVLINNAGYGLHGPVEDVTIQDAKLEFDVNLFGVAALTKEVLPTMRKQGSGTIINVTSVSGKVHLPYAAWYVASKHALEGWSDCLRLEVEPFGIRVAIVQPGAIKTEYFSNAHHAKKQNEEKNIAPATDSVVSPYQENFDVVMKNITTYSQQSGAPPSVIANTILAAVEAKRPKRRYPAGGAGFLLFVRAYFGDAVMDAFLRMFMK